MIEIGLLSGNADVRGINLEMPNSNDKLAKNRRSLLFISPNQEMRLSK